MAVVWRADGVASDVNQPLEAAKGRTGRSMRKEQITIRLDPGMVADARAIAGRKGIGHHTLLRMWVMEGIVRAYEDGVIDTPPQSWPLPDARGDAARQTPARARTPVPLPADARWSKSGRRR